MTDTEITEILGEWIEAEDKKIDNLHTQILMLKKQLELLMKYCVYLDRKTGTGSFPSDES